MKINAIAFVGVPVTDMERARAFYEDVLGLKSDLGPPLIDQVVAGKPADRAGLKAGDRIVAIDGTPVRSPSDVALLTNAKPGGNLVFRAARDGAEFDTTLTAEAVEQGGRTIGIAGVRLRVDPATAERQVVTVRYGPFDALAQGARKTWELSTFTLRMLGRIVTGDASLKNISGPLTMADFAGQSAQQGTLVFVGYLALISISLGVLNLLPLRSGEQLADGRRIYSLLLRNKECGQVLAATLMLVEAFSGRRPRDWDPSLLEWDTPRTLERMIAQLEPSLQRADDPTWVVQGGALRERLLATMPTSVRVGVVHNDFYSNNWRCGASLAIHG